MAREENIYVYEKSIDIDKETLKAVSKNIELERQKAGIIIGFIVIALISTLEYFDSINNNFLKLTIIFSFLFSILFSFIGFISAKMKSGINTQGNFKRDWNNREKFLLFLHESLQENIDNQKMHLEVIRSNIKYSVFGIIILVISLTLTLVL
jgi:hypothetical protein